MILKKYTCPYCGADLKVDLQEKSTICEYCDSVLYFEDTEQEDEKQKEEKADTPPKEPAEDPDTGYSERGVLKGRVLSPYQTVIVKGSSTAQLQTDSMKKRPFKKASSLKSTPKKTGTWKKILIGFLILAFIGGMGSVMEEYSDSSSSTQSTSSKTTAVQSNESKETDKRTETFGDIQYTINNSLVALESPTQENKNYILKGYESKNRNLVIRHDLQENMEYVDFSKDEVLQEKAEYILKFLNVDPSKLISKSNYIVDHTDAMILQIDASSVVNNEAGRIIEGDICVFVTKNGSYLIAYFGNRNDALMPEFKQVLDDIKIINPVSKNMSEVKKSAGETKDEGTVSSSFKELMDKYEAYFDKLLELEEDGEEISIFKTYNFLGDALTYLEVLDQLNNIDTDSLTEAEQDYYKEVLGRISIKLLRFAFVDNDDE